MASVTRAERIRALGQAMRRAQSIGPIPLPWIAGMAAGFVASFVVDALLFGSIPTPWRQLADAAAFTAVAAPVWLVVQRPAVRAAHDVITWLNGWETERWQRELGRRLPGLPRAAPELLDSLPDTMGLRPLRIELLAIRGELEEAEARLARLPLDTPWQRFEHAALDEWISFINGGPPLLEPMRAAAAEVDDAERSLVARATLAAATARRAAVSGGDAIGPLARLRPELGDRPRRYAFPYAAGIVLAVVTMGVVASAAIMATAAIMR